jgi:predicted MFS family arabinose efflux permease
MTTVLLSLVLGGLLGICGIIIHKENQQKIKVEVALIVLCVLLSISLTMLLVLAAKSLGALVILLTIILGVLFAFATKDLWEDLDL